MSKTTEIKVNINSTATHRGLERSTTLNRRYVKRPTKLIITDGTEEVEAKTVAPAVTKITVDSPRVEYRKSKKIAISDDLDKEIVEAKKAAKITHIAPITFDSKENTFIGTPKAKITVEAKEAPDLPPAPNPYQAAINARKKEQAAAKQAEIDSRALKDAAIKKALAEMENASYKAHVAKETEADLIQEAREQKIAERVMLNELKADKKAKKSAKKAEKQTRHFKKHKTGRVILAFATSAACVLALAALVKVNLPNISVKVAAAQTGVEAAYPNYIPRDYSLTGVYTNDQNSVIIEFDGPDNKKFTLAEDKSSWDSNALLTNYVKSAYGTNYDTIREGGITIYISHSNATWVNNGTFYRITSADGTLTKKQIKNIATSL